MRFDDKKIGLSYFANTNLKRKKGGALPIGFPLYASVSYDRRSTTIRVKFLNGKTPYVDKDLNDLKKGEYLIKANEYKEFVVRMVYSELEKNGKIEWTGFGKRVDFYAQNFVETIGKTAVYVYDLVSIKSAKDFLCFTRAFSQVKEFLPEMRVFDWYLGDGKKRSIDVVARTSEDTECDNITEIFVGMIDRLLEG
jgi:hypothetical protein